MTTDLAEILHSWLPHVSFDALFELLPRLKAYFYFHNIDNIHCPCSHLQSVALFTVDVLWLDNTGTESSSVICSKQGLPWTHLTCISKSLFVLLVELLHPLLILLQRTCTDKTLTLLFGCNVCIVTTRGEIKIKIQNCEAFRKCLFEMLPECVSHPAFTREKNFLKLKL